MPSSLLHILSGGDWDPEQHTSTAGSQVTARGPSYYVSGPPRLDFSYSVGHPYHPPSGALGRDRARQGRVVQKGMCKKGGVLLRLR